MPILPKKKVGKMVIFGSKPWVNPLWKNGHFSTFWTCCFYSLERRFFLLEYRKRHFPGLNYLKKKDLEKWPFLNQNQGLTLLEKSQFFDFKTSCFYSLEMCFFVLVYGKRHFPPPYCLKKKVGKMVICGSKAWNNPFEKMAIFDFLNFLLF